MVYDALSESFSVELGEELAASKQYSEQVKRTVHYYGKREDSPQSKWGKDHFTGKVAEFGTSKFIKMNYGIEITPDVSVSAGGKSFSPDLPSQDFVLHVKSQQMASVMSWGLSWIFQWADRFGNTNTGQRDHEIFDRHGLNSFVSFCIVDGGKVTICGMPRVEVLKQKNVFELPKARSLQISKRAVYYSALAKLTLDERWAFLGYLSNRRLTV